MQCEKCQQPIDGRISGFVVCPHCGYVNIGKLNSKPTVAASHSLGKRLAVSLGVIFLAALISGSLLIYNRHQAGALLDQAKAKIAAQQYRDAGALLSKADKLYVYGGLKTDISKTRSENTLWLSYEAKLDQVHILIAKAKFDDAKQLLGQIKANFPGYKKVAELNRLLDLKLAAINKKTVAKKSSHTEQTTASYVPPTKPAAQQVCYQKSGTTTRNTADRADDTGGYQIHLFYAVAKDGKDNAYDTNSRIAKSVSAWQNWLCNQTGGKKLKMDTYGGRLDITFIRFPHTDNQIKTGSVLPWSTNPSKNPYVREYIDLQLKDKGFSSISKIYAVYYDGNSNYSCGGGAWPPTLISHTSAMYLKGGDPAFPACQTNQLATDVHSPAYFEFGFLHEIMHTLGLAATCAPNHTLSGHVSDSSKDLMYAGSKPWQPSILDLDHNDYYKHSNKSCPDLNRSVFFTAGGSDKPPGW